jgi:glycosyltransferase involved in cell wall biosynthesis
MPAYNGHKTIRQAVASVAMQDNLDNILLTIVDDWSDESYDYIISDFHYMKIEILKKPTNTGCGQSRQYGIDRCKCKYFMFLDTDDCLFSPDAVRQMYNRMEENELDILYTDFVQELENNSYIVNAASLCPYNAEKEIPPVAGNADLKRRAPANII